MVAQLIRARPLFSVFLYILATFPAHATGENFASSQYQSGFRAGIEDGGHRKEKDEQYSILPSQEILDRIDFLAKSFPHLATLTNAQDMYGLPTAGDAKDCDFDHFDDVTTGCRNWILTIEDTRAHPPGSESSNTLPEVFLSGALHGNERVGPTTVVEVAHLLLESAACEALPRGLPPSPDADVEVKSNWESDLAAAESCRNKLAQRGITELHRRWLARLVTTRRIVIVPTANALGYFQNRREEAGVDPNRDFPYDLTDPKLCMQTIAGRTINELFREHLFQLSITFHGGMEAIAYEWGAPSYLDWMSPDDEAQAQIANAYSRYAGGFGRHRPYQTGTMNDVVYFVRGGMEDWAYAGSFDPDRVIPCQPEQYGGYPKERTIYDESTLRTFNMLVETSDVKSPVRDDLGTSHDPFNTNSQGNGHISRNIRLALLALDLVQPYVSIVGANGLALRDDVVPLTYRGDRSCAYTKKIMIPPGLNDTLIEWTVGGAMSVDFTTVLFARWGDVPDIVDGASQYDPEHLGLAFRYAPAMGGTTRWHQDGPQPPPSEAISSSISTMGGDSTLGPIFRTMIDTSDFQIGETIAVIAVANVDKSWAMQPDDINPDLPPQSHIVNARTNPQWRHTQASTGKVIQGRNDWYSIPLTLVIGPMQVDEIDSPAGVSLQEGAFEISDRYRMEYGYNFEEGQDGGRDENSQRLSGGGVDENSQQLNSGGVEDDSQQSKVVGKTGGMGDGVITVVVVIIVALVSAFTVVHYKRREQLRRGLKVVMSDEDEHRFGDGTISYAEGGIDSNPDESGMELPKFSID